MLEKFIIFIKTLEKECPFVLEMINFSLGKKGDLQPTLYKN